MRGKSNRQRFNKLTFIAIKYLLIVLTTVSASLVTPIIIYFSKLAPSTVTATDMLISMVSLYLQFSFGNNIYIKLCGKCHGIIESKLTSTTATTTMSEIHQ